MWQTGLQRVTTAGRHGALPVPRHAQLPPVGHVPLHGADRPAAHLVVATAPTQITTGNNDDTSKLIGDRAVRLRRRQGRLADAHLEPAHGLVGDARRSGCACRCATSSTSTTRRTRPRCRTSSRARSTSATTSSPGIDKLIRGNVQTYFAKAPYMLSANTAWLVPNLTKKPLDDRNFRRALATSIDIDRIVRDDYGRIVAKANPTGLLPIWNKWIDQAQVRRLGFTYSTARAKQILQQNGYRDTNGDGFVENKDGLAARPPADRAERLVGLDDGDPDDRRQREGRRHPDHARLPGLQRPRRGAQHGEVRPRDQQRGAALEQPVRLLRLPVPPADRGDADDAELPALPEHQGVEPDHAAEQDQGPRRPASGSTVSCSRSSSPSCPRSRSGTTACGPSTTRGTGRTSPARPDPGSRTRRRRGTAT